MPLTMSSPTPTTTTIIMIVIKVSEGVPHSLRPILWPRLLDIEAKKERLGLAYKDVILSQWYLTHWWSTIGRNFCQILTASQDSSSSAQCFRQIEKDLLRTLPTNICFAKPQSVGVQRYSKMREMRNVLAQAEAGFARPCPSFSRCRLLPGEHH